MDKYQSALEKLLRIAREEFSYSSKIKLIFSDAEFSSMALSNSLSNSLKCHFDNLNTLLDSGLNSEDVLELAERLQSGLYIDIFQKWLEILKEDIIIRN